MNDLKIFTNEQFGSVRTVIKDSEPWFVAADVCKALEISNNRDALSRLDADEKSMFKIETSGGPQNMLAVCESGLYALILGSRKKEAHQFRRWVTKEVLPQIRKNLAMKSENALIDEKEEERRIIPFPRKIYNKKRLKMEYAQRFDGSLNNPFLNCEFGNAIIEATAENQVMGAYLMNDNIILQMILDIKKGLEPNFKIYTRQDYGRIKEECYPIEYAGYVYVIEYGDYIKIGQSRNPYNRITQLRMQAENYGTCKLGRVAVSIPCSNYENIEKLLHEFWSEFRKESTELFDIPFDFFMDEVESHKIRIPYRINISESAKGSNGFLDGMKKIITGEAFES